MKTRESVTLVCAVILGILAQTPTGYGQVFQFSNFGVNGGARAPIYGPEAGDPYQRRWGNTATATPAGTQSYSGALLAGSNYFVEAWYSLSPVEDLYALNPNAARVPDSLKFFLTGTGSGYFFGGDRTILDANPTGSIPPFSVYLQIRAWENTAGQFPTWEDAYSAALAGGQNPIGWSSVFLQPLNIGLPPPEGMYNFQSFNIAVVPEPSLSALALLGVAVLFASARISRRKLPR